MNGFGSQYASHNVDYFSYQKLFEVLKWPERILITIAYVTVDRLLNNYNINTMILKI